MTNVNLTKKNQTRLAKIFKYAHLSISLLLKILKKTRVAVMNSHCTPNRPKNEKTPKPSEKARIIVLKISV